ncbi:ABC transporter permease (plasmid) [Paraburkholderia sprentiae WSM5005]|uniref:ABC transporter permease n=1 Tax=Paraburkholderia sprentiae WSM5005 TaxID=754502 RepID=A0A1I9YTD2_9BURK|nr:ABC transporter permease [Paraburkholderia sprentiae]APA89477.1 ABC transporter permease [Paraburkholderia sprentiae WSM5005]
MKPKSRRAFLLALAVIVLVGGQFAVPGFASLGQLANQLKIATFLGLFGIAQSLVMIAGDQGLDLSVGAAATLGGILGAALLGPASAGLPAAFAVATLAGALVGALNGVGITLLCIPPLVMTLAMASLVDGGLIVWSSVMHVNTAASPALAALAGRTIAGVPSVALIWLVAGALMWRFLDHSAWGRRLMATGANPIAAAIAGTRVRAIRIAVYVASGIIAALTGVLLVGYVGQAFLGLGTTYVLPSVVVAVIGGVSLAGGRGDYIAVAIAAVLLTVLTSLLTALQIGEAGRQCIFGATLLVFLALNGWSFNGALRRRHA